MVSESRIYGVVSNALNYRNRGRQTADTAPQLAALMEGNEHPLLLLEQGLLQLLVFNCLTRSNRDPQVIGNGLLRKPDQYFALPLIESSVLVVLRQNRPQVMW